VIGEARTLNQLIHALTDSNPRVAQRAATALGKSGDPRGFHALLMALHHPSSDVRYAACGALANLHIAEAIAPLEELSRVDARTTSWGASVADAARRAIQGIQVALPSGADTETEFSRLNALLEKHQSGHEER
jgi:HEAT repeat protein